jgi:3-phosphoshikimate 1-carboxyvinyltransferase
VKNLSSAADTVTLNEILQKLRVQNSELRVTGEHSQLLTDNSQLVDIGPAGTAMRFLTSYAAVKDLDVTLTGSERMKQRPIGILVDALHTLGARISYAEKEGFPPIKIEGGFEQRTKRVKIKGDVSSQYITALLLVGPTLPRGIELEIVGKLTSRPYVEMTLGLMEQCGIRYEWLDNKIYIGPQEFLKSQLTVEPDWSAASYWYSIAALAGEAEIELPNLRKYSLQGDSRITEIMANFGISSTFTNNSVIVKKEAKAFKNKHFDLKDCPDLAQTVIVCCAALGYEANFTGLETLKIKETDRVLALQNELAKIGVKLIEDNFNYTLDCSGLHFPEKITIKTYEDHRMAMAFAPLALLINEVEIEEPEVVAKSYPHFWDDLKKAGFEISSTE